MGVVTAQFGSSGPVFGLKSDHSHPPAPSQGVRWWVLTELTTVKLISKCYIHFLLSVLLFLSFSIRQGGGKKKGRARARLLNLAEAISRATRGDITKKSRFELAVSNCITLDRFRKFDFFHPNFDFFGPGGNRTRALCNPSETRPITLPLG